jgi:hypothetical protein
VFPQSEGVVSGESVNNFSHILFNKTPEQLRRLGARGGKAYARNQRGRRALLATVSKPLPPPVAPLKTAAETIALLDQQFPWLRGAEKRVPRGLAD